MQFDYVSDLHIDHWDKRFTTKTQYGEAKDYPIDWSKANSEILIIAGDISDDINVSIKYIKEIKKYYKKILFVDGNHEHYCVKPNLLDSIKFTKAIKKIKDVYFLPTEDVIIENTLVIGFCCWWDYDGGKSKIEYKNIYDRANSEYKSLIKRLDNYKDDDSIKEIIIVTHTVPLPRFVRQKETDHNSNLITINHLNYPKITRWVFGHNHYKYNLIGYKINYISNPRGRPEDYDRETYKILTSK